MISSIWLETNDGGKKAFASPHLANRFPLIKKETKRFSGYVFKNRESQTREQFFALNFIISLCFFSS
jgi:hypothetical protein